MKKRSLRSLGVILSPEHWIFARGGKEIPSGSGNASVGDVHTIPPLGQSNAIGAAILKQPNYPAYQPITTGQLVPLKIQASNTTEVIINNALRLIALRSGDKPPEVGGPSSAGMAHMLLNRKLSDGFHEHRLELGGEGKILSRPRIFHGGGALLSGCVANCGPSEQSGDLAHRAAIGRPLRHRTSRRRHCTDQ